MPKAPQPDDNLKATASVDIVLAALESASAVKVAIDAARKHFPMMSWHNAIQFLTGKRFALQLAGVELDHERTRYLLAQKVALELGTEYGWSGACPPRPEVLERIEAQLRRATLLLDPNARE